MNKRAVHRLAVVALLLALAACEQPSRPGAQPGGTAGASGPAGALVVPIGSGGTPYEPLWLDDGLYFGVEPKNDNDRHTLWRWRDGRAEQVRLRLPDDCYGSLLGSGDWRLATGDWRPATAATGPRGRCFWRRPG